MTVEFGVLGSVEAIIDGRPARLGHARQRGVLAALLVDVNRLVTSDQLADRVWGDRLPAQARATLHGYLSHLRLALAATSEARIVREPGGYVLLTADTVTVDLHCFRQLVARARTSDDDQRAAELFEQALRLWRAEAFAALDTPWINALRHTLGEERLAVQLDLGERRLRLGQHAALLPELLARAAEHPLDERLAGQVMLALHGCGRAADALEYYRYTRRRLTRELGIGPGPSLRDIETAILRQDTIPTRSLSEGPAELSTTPAQLPLAVTAFAGRGAELDELDDLVAGATGMPGTGPERPPAMVISAVSGTAGVGKTALAVHWAHRVRDAFPDGQLYVNLRGFDPGGLLLSPAEAVRRFLDAFGVPAAGIPPGLEAQTGLYRSLLTGRRVLVVLDNARDAEQVRPLLPGSPGCLALITSRNRLTSLAAAEGARLLTVDLLAPAEARDLLTGRLGAHRVAAEPAALENIVARCAGLPLALAIVAARAAAQPRFPLAALAEELRQSSRRLDALDAGDPATQVRAVFSWSYHSLSDEAARVFRLLGLHPGPDVGVPAVAGLAGVSPASAGTLLVELTRGHLLTERVPGRYTFHDLLRTYATELVTTHEGSDTRHAATHRMLDHYLHTAHAADSLLTRKQDPITLSRAQPGAAAEGPSDYQQALAWFITEYPVLLAVIEQAPAGFDGHTWQLASTLTTFLDRQGHWPALAAAQTTALDAARHQEDRTGQATAHRCLGLALARLDRPDAARTHYRLALALFCDLGSHVGQARTHQDLARMAGAQGRPREALEHAHHSLRHYQAADDRGGQSAALNHIGWFNAQLGDHHQALTHCRRALSLSQEIGDLNGQAHTWDSLGYIQHHLGQYEQSIDCYRQALDLFRRTGDRHSEATGLAYLGDTQHTADNPGAARDAWTQALALTRELGLPDTDPLRTKILHHLDQRC